MGCPCGLPPTIFRIEIKSLTTACQVGNCLERPLQPHSSGTPLPLTLPRQATLPTHASEPEPTQLPSWGSPPQSHLTELVLVLSIIHIPLQCLQRGLNLVRYSHPRVHYALMVPHSNHRKTPQGQDHYLALLNKQWLNKYPNDKGKRGNGKATEFARFDREGRQSLLRPYTGGTSCTSFMGVTECTPRARPQTGQYISRCLPYWAHTPGTQSLRDSTHKHILGTLLPDPMQAGGRC